MAKGYNKFRIPETFFTEGLVLQDELAAEQQQAAEIADNAE
jgi:hypothetical protein